jgi:hypothetical protein
VDDKGAGPIRKDGASPSGVVNDKDPGEQYND